MPPLASLADPDLAFRLGNAVALVGWLALALAMPSRRFAPFALRLAGRAIPLLLAAGYVVLLVAHWGAGGFGSLAEVRQLFDRPGLLAAGWLHYLAFDLFVGSWIAQRSLALGLPHLLLVPLLLLTFLFGPAGLLAFALLRPAWQRRAAVRGGDAAAPR